MPLSSLHSASYNLIEPFLQNPGVECFEIDFIFVGKLRIFASQKAIAPVDERIKFYFLQWPLM